jgi:hypothetical protein
MHCPSCGAETNLEQRFCRSCGMDLETVSKLVAEYSSPENLKLEKSLTQKTNQQRMYESIKWGMISLILGMAALVIVKTLAFDKTYNLIGALLLFISMGLLCFGALSTMREVTSTRKPRTSDRTAELPESQTTKELPAARVPVPVASVTERTTQLIESEVVSRPRE